MRKFKYAAPFCISLSLLKEISKSWSLLMMTASSLPLSLLQCETLALTCFGGMAGLDKLRRQAAHAPERKSIKKTERETKETWLLPHVRGNQLQVGSSGNPIQPLVAEILNIYQLIGGGGEPLLVFVVLCLLACKSLKKKKPPRWPRFQENGIK